jgi:hypothetical protein
MPRRETRVFLTRGPSRGEMSGGVRTNGLTHHYGKGATAMNPTTMTSATGQELELYYRHTGKIPPAAVLMGLAAGAAVGVAAAWAYAYADVYIPIIYLNFVATAAFGGAVGFVAARVAKAGKLRNYPATLLIVSVATLVAYYFSWVFWVKAVFDRYVEDHDLTVGALIESPRLLGEVIGFVYDKGTWSVGHGTSSKGENVSGAFLGIVWVAEALTVLGAALMVARALVRDEMFCEACDRWCGKARTLRRIEPGNSVSAKAELEAHRVGCLDGPPPTSAARYWTVDYDHCPRCKQLHAVSVSDVTVTADKKGNAKTATRKFVNKLLMTPAEAAAVQSPAAPPAAVAAGTEAEADAPFVVDARAEGEADQ